MIDIIKGGLRMQVSEQAYDNLYKPNGWNIDTQVESQESEYIETVKELATPQRIANYKKMVDKQPKIFSDNLFYSER